MGRGSRRRRRKRKRRRKQEAQKREQPLRIEIHSEAVQIDEGTTCPLCRDAVVPGDVALPAVRCAGCQTVYHRPCFSELGGCSVLGCGRVKLSGPDIPRLQERRRRHTVEDPSVNPEPSSGLSLTAWGLLAVGLMGLASMLMGSGVAALGFLLAFCVVGALAFRPGRTNSRG